ncbi:MAG: hypothetical protein EP297_08860 [Gammaproteobacteria bacterium]|nr:MAG: hypothetical protein EP297_08860 [Gammaproteobacteria bacterium]
MKFAEKHPVLSVFWQICLLRQGPEVLPKSMFLLYLLLPLYFLLGVFTAMTTYGLTDSVYRSGADLVITVSLAYVFVHLAGRQQRFLQMLTALIGTGLILGVFFMPFLVMIQTDLFSKAALITVIYILFLWEVFIIGNIFSRTFALSLPAGFLIAMSYVLLAMLMFYSVFPESG